MSTCDLPRTSDYKSPRYYHVRLESECSLISEGEESILTIQDRETDAVEDSSDIDTQSDISEVYKVGDVLVEYEVASLSEEEDEFLSDFSSSGSSNDIPLLELEGYVAAVLGDSSVFESDVSSADEELAAGKADFKICAQCRRTNDDPTYRLCTNCFQKCWRCKMTKDNSCFTLCSSCYKVRKKMYPPRPRPSKKHRSPDSRSKTTVDIGMVKSCLNELQDHRNRQQLSQDSGLGSSQELPSLDLENIIVPEQKKEKPTPPPPTSKRKRSDGEEEEDGYDTDDDDLFRPQKAARKDGDAPPDVGGLFQPVIGDKIVDLSPPESIRSCSDYKDICGMCNMRTKDSAFLHGNSAHSCCCYKCAMRSWKTWKKCPICNKKVKNVVKLFTM